MAQGTAAGITIANNVPVDYQVGGVDQVTVTGNDTFTVDWQIDVNVNFMSGRRLPCPRAKRMPFWPLT